MELEGEAAELLAFAITLGAESRDLDDLVIDLQHEDAAVELNHDWDGEDGNQEEEILRRAEDAACAINNGSLEEQIPFLLEQLGLEGAKREIVKACAPGGPPELIGGPTIFHLRGAPLTRYGNRWAVETLASIAPHRFQLDSKRDVFKVMNRDTGEWQEAPAVHASIAGRLATVFPLTLAGLVSPEWNDEDPLGLADAEPKDREHADRPGRCHAGRDAS